MNGLLLLGYLETIFGMMPPPPVIDFFRRGRDPCFELSLAFDFDECKVSFDEFLTFW